MVPNFKISVRPEYLKDQSLPAQRNFVFAYTVRIENHSEKTAQLIDRHWIITDGEGRVQEVTGDGVIGLQPHIKPGQHFEYSSFCPLPTGTGSMSGSYGMLGDEGDKFRIDVPLFFFVEPGSFN
ncbi:MAG: Co2+/Mg2+ efflux protein ApaG [Bdellovibrionales bacterium CG10_big_fil_rev_8_21_14_0_10_45_34]|nr:MAG: Co2+/Mg2+ efflux protein ApaG [Bdellovibrionales bacterium CG10_big_fil_rev_8_21_14_0_10_45_34]